MKRLKTA